MKKFFACAAVAGFAILGVAAPAQAAADPEQNKPSYWANYTPENDTCYKIELNEEGSFTLEPLSGNQFYTLLVLKAGTGNELIPYPVAGKEYISEIGKGLSHAIYCVAVRQS